ncbi:MAG TPA: hypothetical protein VFZ66_23740 [Herpetosiphonaceae bacterium]
MVKRSAYYRRIHSELQAPVPSDVWNEASWGFYVFDLRHTDQEQAEANTRVVIFAVELEQQTLEAVKVVSSGPSPDEAEIEDLMERGERLLVPLPVDWA